MKNAHYVITGGPGVGKTTLLEALAMQGYQCVAEVARRIIQQQVQIGGSALPWANKTEYANLMWTESVKSYQENTAENPSTPIFFDRGLLDTVCYMEMENIPMHLDQFELLKSPLYDKVFLLPPWKEIYHTDSERKQSWKEAKQTFEFLRKVYRKYGYTIIEVPKLPVEERVNFILEKL